MQCPDCGGLRHKGSCVEYELDVWFWQEDDAGYGEWIFDNHCTLAEFVEANDFCPIELMGIYKLCEQGTEFTIGGGAAPLFRNTPSRPTVH